MRKAENNCWGFNAAHLCGICSIISAYGLLLMLFNVFSSETFPSAKARAEISSSPGGSEGIERHKSQVDFLTGFVQTILPVMFM